MNDVFPESQPAEPKSTATGPTSPVAVSRQVIDNPWLIVGTLFLVTAALGLPLLWISRGFSRTSKVILTIVVLLYTALILWLFWLVMVWAYTRIVNAL